MSTVYLLHFSRPYQHARHYIGWTNFLKKRLEHHRNGTGARLTKAVAAAGIEMKVARVWDNQKKAFERQLKNQKHAARLCPICNGEHALKHMTGERKQEVSTEQENENYGRNFWI